MTLDGLGGAGWECASTDPGAVVDPDSLARTDLAWIAASVPGTAAGALQTAGLWQWGAPDSDVLDGRDWWFRTRFPAPDDGPWVLRLHGLATIADVWLNGRHRLHSDNMFVAHELDIDTLEPSNELCIRFAALDPVLAVRRTRPRWKSVQIRNQNLRGIRTTLLGRMDGSSAWAAPVGPWRPVELVPRPAVRVTSSNLDVRCVDRGGSVSVHATLAITGYRPTRARVRVGEATGALELSDNGEEVTVAGTLALAAVERWWPHSHGAQPRYPVVLEIDNTTIPMAAVGFRTIEVDRHDDGFTFVVNGVAIFCRGAVWVPPDVTALTATPQQLRTSLALLRDTGMNMVRLDGYGTYESADFWDLCDELGILVWQDCMLAAFDPPDDEAFTAAIDTEVTQVLTQLQGRPALALVCGSNETYQQAALFGLEPGSWTSAVLEHTLPAVVARTLPTTAYIPSSPIGGQLPFDPANGVSHYFGVGAYRRPLSDARLGDVRFAAECLAFSTPPERASIREMFAGSSDPQEDTRWDAGVPRDTGASWDFEDVRDFYVESLFGCDPEAAKLADPDWGLDVGRAAVAEVMTAVMSEWRRPGSHCAGGLVLSWQDLGPGAGWGLVDSLGRAKAPLYALRRALDPLAVLLTDEGLSGLQVHVVNDRPRPFRGRLQLDVYAESGLRLEHADTEIEVGAHGARTVSATELLGGFRDLTRAYRFGPPEHDVVCARLISADDGSEREAFYLPLGRGRPRRSDLDLSAAIQKVGAHEWTLRVATRLFAQWVSVDVPGYTASDSWFHLAPGASREIALRAPDPDQLPQGEVHALNANSPVSIVVERSAVD